MVFGLSSRSETDPAIVLTTLTALTILIDFTDLDNMLIHDKLSAGSADMPSVFLTVAVRYTFGA